MEDAEDAHGHGAAVLDAVLLSRREVEARAGPERDRLAVDVREPLSLDDVADLVVGMAVEGRFARLDDAHELGHVEAPGVLVDEVLERPLAGGGELGLVGEADRDAPIAACRLTVGGDDDRHDMERFGARVVDHVRLAGRHEDAGVRLEPIRPSVELELAAARDDVEDLLALADVAGVRPSRLEADDALLEQLATARAIEGDLDFRSVP
jgi:hypothetical protein